MSSIAVALERMGFEYRVPAEESFMFGQRHVRDIATSVAKGIPIWRRGVPKTGTEGFALPGGQFVATGTTELPPLPTEIRFTFDGRNAPRFALFGWDFDDPEICWSNRRVGRALFPTRAGNVRYDRVARSHAGRFGAPADATSDRRTFRSTVANL